MLSTLTKNNFFKNNLNDLKTHGKLISVITWKIENLISVTKSATSVPAKLSQNDESVTDPIKMANIFDNFFSSIAAKTKSKIKSSKTI